RRSIDNHHIDQKWADALGSFFKKRPELLVQRRQASNTAANIDPHIIGNVSCDFQASLSDGLPAGGYSKLLIWIVATHFFTIQVERGVKSLQLSAKMDTVAAGVV